MGVERDKLELARLGALCVGGGVAEAELQLHDWCRRDDAPAAARLLLGSLLARRGAMADAMAVLDRPHSRPRDGSHHSADADADLTRLMICVLAAVDLHDTARRLARLLHDSHGHHPVIAAWLTALDAHPRKLTTTASHASVEHLAAELIESPHVIPSLVAAAAIDRREADIDLLRGAVHRIAADAQDDRQLLSMCQAMAQLAMLAGEPDDARRWAHRGLKIDAYNATLALTLSTIDDDLQVGPAAADVLRRVASVHPAYSDVRASLIRRERHDGRRESAQIKLAQWLEQDPANPLALDLVREMAA